MVTVKRKKKLIRFEDVKIGTFFNYPGDSSCDCCLKFAEAQRTREEWEEDGCAHFYYNAFVYPDGVMVEFHSNDMVEVIDVTIEVQ